MNESELRIIHLNDVPQGGFGGIVEKQMVVSPKLAPNASNRKDISHGLGDFIYLATGYFKPHDGASLHPHDNVDIVTVVWNGSIGHEGTLGDGTVIHAPGVQVQRAGTGMRHLEVNTGDGEADFTQIWFLPPERGLSPDYQNISLEDGKLTTVLGGNCSECFDNNMTCEVGFIPPGQSYDCGERFVAFIARGEGLANGVSVAAGDLLEGAWLRIEAETGLQIVVIY